MFYINENFICLYRNDSNRVTWNLKTDVFTNKNSISRIEKWYSGNVYVNGHASYNIHMIGYLLLRHVPVSIYIWYVIHVCDRTDSWRTLNMTMCLILKNNRREMLKTRSGRGCRYTCGHAENRDIFHAEWTERQKNVRRVTNWVY